MKISEFVANYTDGKGVFLSHVYGEVVEMFEELFKADLDGINEEVSDVIAFSQMYLYWNYKYDGKLWGLGLPSFNKFMERRKVWGKIYKKAGLDSNISNFCGNYKRKEKVVKHLSNFGISEPKALLVYSEVVV
jgi:hypothetical protein